MGKKRLKQHHTYHECGLTSDISTLSQFSNLGLKYNLPRLQSPVWGGGGGRDSKGSCRAWCGNMQVKYLQFIKFYLIILVNTTTLLLHCVICYTA